MHELPRRLLLGGVRDPVHELRCGQVSNFDRLRELPHVLIGLLVGHYKRLLGLRGGHVHRLVAKLDKPDGTIRNLAEMKKELRKE